MKIEVFRSHKTGKYHHPNAERGTRPTQMKIIFLFIALTCAAIAQDLPLPKDPPTSTISSNPPSNYAQWYLFGKYWYADALTNRAKVSDLTAKLANLPTLSQIAADISALRASFDSLGVVKITVTAASSSATVAWDNTSPGATGFRIERSIDGTTFAQIGDVPVTVTSYVDKNLSPGSYWYRVRAYNSTLTSLYSNTATYAQQ